MRKLLLAAAALPLIAVAPALAQNASPATTSTAPNTMANPGPDATNPVANPPAHVPSQGPNFISVPDTAMLTSNVVGLDIYNAQNNDIGKIQDVVVDGGNTVQGYILSVGGFLGMGTHYVAVNPAAVSITYDSNAKTWRAAMNATKDQLKAAPEFQYGGKWTASRS
jgi:sporulation protein YlmC with PRC-barrel domain